MPHVPGSLTFNEWEVIDNQTLQPTGRKTHTIELWPADFPSSLRVATIERDVLKFGPLFATSPKLLDALKLAEATIERLHRHAPGSANGTLDVIRLALAEAEPDSMAAAYSQDEKEGAD